jgi:hypothetical protein
MTKTQEIREKLEAGETPVDLKKQGYKHGLIYKVNKQMKTTTLVKSEPVNVKPSPKVTLGSNDIDADPEIYQLKKDIRKAELERKLAEVVAPMEAEPRIKALEDRLTEMENAIDWACEGVIDLQTIMDNTPLSGLWQKHQCSCGAENYLAIVVQCTKCGKEYLYKK